MTMGLNRLIDITHNSVCEGVALRSASYREFLELACNAGEASPDAVWRTYARLQSLMDFEERVHACFQRLDALSEAPVGVRLEALQAIARLLSIVEDDGLFEEWVAPLKKMTDCLVTFEQILSASSPDAPGPEVQHPSDLEGELEKADSAIPEGADYASDAVDDMNRDLDALNQIEGGGADG